MYYVNNFLGSSDDNGIELAVITQVFIKKSKESVSDLCRTVCQALRCYFSVIEWREVSKGRTS